MKVQVKIEYTMLPMRFGWRELRTEEGKAYYFKETSGETSWLRPAYDFQDEKAAMRIQSQFRVMQGRLDFKRKIQDESLLKVLS